MTTNPVTGTSQRKGCSPAGCLNPFILVPYLLYLAALQAVFWVLTNGALAQRVPACWGNTWLWASPSCFIEIGYGAFFFEHLVSAFVAFVVATCTYGFFLAFIALLSWFIVKGMNAAKGRKAPPSIATASAELDPGNTEGFPAGTHDSTDQHRE